jgi:hypothetical protein
LHRKTEDVDLESHELVLSLKSNLQPYDPKSRNPPPNFAELPGNVSNPPAQKVKRAFSKSSKAPRQGRAANF